MSAEKLTRFLVARAKEKGLTPMAFSRSQNIPYAAAWRIINGQYRRPDLGTILALIKALDMTLCIHEFGDIHKF